MQQQYIVKYNLPNPSAAVDQPNNKQESSSQAARPLVAGKKKTPRTQNLPLSISGGQQAGTTKPVNKYKRSAADKIL